MKIIIPVFTFVAVYSFLSIFFGPKGVFAAQQLKRQQDILIRHVQQASEISEQLDIRIANLTSNPDTIAMYAHELGYVYPDERLIKLQHFSGAIEQSEDPGSLYTVIPPHFLPDSMCKTIAVSASIIAVLCGMLLERNHAYFKNKS